MNVFSKANKKFNAPLALSFTELIMDAIEAKKSFTRSDLVEMVNVKKEEHLEAILEEDSKELFDYIKEMRDRLDNLNDRLKSTISAYEEYLEQLSKSSNWNYNLNTICQKLNEIVIEIVPFQTFQYVCKTEINYNDYEHYPSDFDNESENLIGTFKDFNRNTDNKLPFQKNKFNILNDGKQLIEPFKSKSLKKLEINSKYESVADYLDTLYNLFRQDFISSYRESIEKVKMGKDIGKYCVEIMLIGSESNKFMYKFEIINYKRNYNYLPGSLFVLTKEKININEISIGILFFQKDEHLYLSIENYQLLSNPNNNTKNYFAISSNAFYQNYQYTLERLQEHRLYNNIPVCESIVFANYNNYNYNNHNNEIWDFSCLIRNNSINNNNNNNNNYNKYKRVNLSVDDNWPQANEIDLDHSQLDGLKSILLQKLSLIKGPPGTGKTHLITQFLRLVRANRKSNQNPILIVAQTRHTLHDIFSKLLNYFNQSELAIIGGNQMLPADGLLKSLQKCNLKYLKTKFLLKNKKTVKWNIEEIKNRLNDKINKLKEQIEYYNTYFDHTTFDNYIFNGNLDQFDYEKFKINEIEQFSCFFNYKKLCEFYRHAYNNNKNFDSLVDIEIQDAYRRHNLCKIINEEQVFDENRVLLDWLHLGPLKCVKNQREEFNKDENIGQKPNGNFSRATKQRKSKSKLIKGITHSTRKQRIFHIMNNNNNTQTMDEDLIKNEEQIDLWQLNEEKRCMFYKSLISTYIRYKKDCENNIKKLMEEYAYLENEFDIKENNLYKQVLQEKLIIGLTTCGVAKYSKYLEKLKCETILFEESGKILEAQLIGSLFQSINRIVLVGDNDQLDPQCENYSLQKHYGLSISLFERLTKTNYPTVCLRTQYRIKEHIAQNTTQLFYPNIKFDYNSKYHSLSQDIQSVINKCMPSDFLFIQHNKMQDIKQNESSKSNKYEALYILNLCNYLLNNGCDSKSITILVPYIAQFNEFKRIQNNTHEIKYANKNLSEIQISIIDNFQGHENHIIFVSLTRSNNKNIIGFLKDDKRINVALSRSKFALYVVGNFYCFEQRSNEFSKIIKNMKNLNRVKTIIELKSINIFEDSNKNFDSRMVRIGNCDDFQKLYNQNKRKLDEFCEEVDLKKIKLSKQI